MKFAAIASRLLIVSVLVLSSTAFAQSSPSTGVFPQSSVYWDARRPGEGVYLEVQGSSAAFIIFGYEADGSQLFYSGGGQIRSASGGAQRPEGWFPMHFLQSELFQTSNGPPFADPSANNPRQYESRSVGEAFITFDTQGFLSITYQLTGDVPPDVSRTSLRFYSQFNFGHSRIGSNGSFQLPCKTDLRGEWVFVDKTDPQSSPWRFDFSEIESNIPLEEVDCSSSRLAIISYFDRDRDAELRCVHASNANRDPLDGLSKSICELRLGDELAEEFWFEWDDASLGRITATLGEFPGPTHQRGPERVVGWRVQ